jgi:predicted DNA-binding protein
MPTKNPRISVTLTNELSDILGSMSDLTGTSKSALVAELLQQSLPVFERMVAALAAAKTLQAQAGGGMAEIGEGLRRAQERIETQLGFCLDTLDEGLRPVVSEAEKVARRGRRGDASAATRRARRGASTPVPVTRGLGASEGGIQGEETQVVRRTKRG